ncbi:3-deoxy-manno-octulosonate cytidylyltransferase [Lacihabitans lacunae]|uniref:3-deoxy-manno-octulosonate cytidylyltransferase n=1 Tax=Lacihabitans lacunae TaxID=1028214 RepID=A0ABV7YRU8_9BACT
MKILGIIPARMASSRFPAKLLKEVNGVSILQMVYQQCLSANLLSKVVVATDHDDIFEHVKAFGGHAIMTNTKHQSGTDRCAEALEVMGGSANYDFVVNIQGDEPLISPTTINDLCLALETKSEVITVCKKIVETETLLNPNVVKVVIGENKQALYFSRSPIPFYRESGIDFWVKDFSYFRHMGIYAFRSDVLQGIVKLHMSPLENCEKLEQLRWLSNGITIKVIETQFDSLGIDTEEDFEQLKQFLNKK